MLFRDKATYRLIESLQTRKKYLQPETREKRKKKGNKVFLSAFYSLQFAVLYVADTGKTTAAALYTNVEWERERERSIQGRQSASSVFF